MRAGAVMALALSLWGCSKGTPEPELNCLANSRMPWRACGAVECPAGFECFQRKEAHCFRNGPQTSCAATGAECDEWRRYVGSADGCQLTSARALAAQAGSSHPAP